jgi:hypothetical protein
MSELENNIKIGIKQAECGVDLSGSGQGSVVDFSEHSMKDRFP